MELLKKRIQDDGVIQSDSVLKVPMFLNHQIDIELLDALGAEWARIFAGEKVNKILTIEASGIAIATCAARHFDNCPVVFAKKAHSINLTDQVYSTQVKSFTHNNIFDVIVQKDLLSDKDHLLIIDDFLAMGSAMQGLIDIAHRAQTHITGIGIAIEKGFQPGGKMLRNMGYRVESLAIIDKLDPQKGKAIFRKQA